MQKTGCALLAASSLLLSAACAAGSQNSVQTDTQTAVDTAPVSQEETQDPLGSSLQDKLDFGGRKIRIAHRDKEAYAQEVASELTGETLDDAVYARNLALEDRLKVSIQPVVTLEHPQKMADMIRQSIHAGTPDYDIVAGVQWTTSQLVMQN